MCLLLPRYVSLSTYPGFRCPRSWRLGSDPFPENRRFFRTSLSPRSRRCSLLCCPADGPYSSMSGDDDDDGDLPTLTFRWHRARVIRFSRRTRVVEPTDDSSLAILAPAIDPFKSNRIKTRGWYKNGRNKGVCARA